MYTKLSQTYSYKINNKYSYIINLFVASIDTLSEPKTNLLAK